MREIIEIVRENIGIRDVLTIGYNDEILNELKKHISNKIIIVGEEYEDGNKLSQELIGKREEIYVIFLSQLQNEEITIKMSSLGYLEKRDVLWIKHRPFGIQDECFGNKVNIKSKINLRLNGWGSEINIGENVNLPTQLNIGSKARVQIGNNVKMKSGWFGELHNCQLIIGDNVEFGVNTNIWVLSEAILEIGNNCEFGNDLILRPHSHTKIQIGNDCLFSWNCVVLGGDGHAIFDNETGQMINSPSNKNCNVSIGEHVWVAGETVILGGTSIGAESVTGYRSLLKGVYGKNLCIVGSPARVLRENINWSRKFGEIEDRIK